MATNNNLKDRDAQLKILEVAFGLQAVTGDLAWSFNTGTAPSNIVTAYHALGEGEWDGIDQLFFKGVQIPSSDYHWHSGALATGMLSGPQQVDSWFAKDVPHSRTAAIGFKCPVGLADADTLKNPPEGFKGIFRTKKVPNFNSSGTQTDFAYSANPARCIVELLKSYARLPNLPTTYSALADYWISRIDWANWCDFRDYHEQTETVDYTTITDFDGIGLTASFFSDTALTRLVRSFIQPTMDSQGTASAPPVYGVSGGSFSARFEGKIRAKYSETYTFRVTHDDGAKLWVNGSLIVDKWTTTGTDTGTIALTAGQLYDIKLEWKNTTGNWDIRLEWNSTSQPYETVPETRLYPVASTQKLYETHVRFTAATNPADAIREILFQSNSKMQDVNGKLRFYCLEDLSSTFTLDDAVIDRFSFRRRDILQADPVTALEAKFQDIESNYLEEPFNPVQVELDTFNRKTAENVQIINLFNTTRWRARKILQMRAKLDFENRMFAELEAKQSKSYPIVAGDVITVDHRKLSSATTFLVREAVDRSTADIGGGQGTEAESRTFTLQEWAV